MSVLGAGSFPPSTSISLVTRKNTPIKNSQDWGYSRFVWVQTEKLRKKYTEPFASPLADTICPVYNCHGLTFASRRTFIDESENKNLVALILDEDGFDEISSSKCQPGDVIVYYDQAGEILHSGFVILSQKTPQGIHDIRIWSKWGVGEEWTHNFSVCPYMNPGGAVRYFRLKRWDKK